MKCLVYNLLTCTITWFTPCRILTCLSEPTCACFSPSRASLVIAGMVSGVFTYVCTSLDVLVHTHTHTHIHIHIHMHTCMYTHTCTHVHLCMYTQTHYMCICTHMHTYACTHSHICTQHTPIHTHTHTHMHILNI